MKEKMMTWCEAELNTVLRGGSAEKACDRCYGIMMFVVNELVGYDTPEGKEILDWWDNDMHPKFYEYY